MKEEALPRYEWHLMDVATRARFTAYSYELSSTFGFLFLNLVLLWLRAHGVHTTLRIRLDNGGEFCGEVVENAHRQDDEASLMVHAERCEHTPLR
ncbi:MAG: hypothetical protein DRG36_05720 [Deltaproteobacteria bacterium]|nr:MAG: hypothetical protein DRG36_05720 [Deltaproteobacteria bacterium]